MESEETEDQAVSKGMVCEQIHVTACTKQWYKTRSSSVGFKFGGLVAQHLPEILFSLYLYI